MPNLRIVIVWSLLLLGYLAIGRAEETKLVYPAARRVDQADKYHGVEVQDPYRWLETDPRQSEEVRQWVDAQNELSTRYLRSDPRRAAIRSLLERVWNYERFSPPVKAGPLYAYLKNDGLQAHAVLYARSGLEGTPRVLLDPNAWSKDGSLSLAGFDFNLQGTRLAYGISESGSDWQTWRILDVETGKVLDDELRWLKFSTAAWTKDGTGFYYTRYDEPPADETFRAVNLNNKVFYHRVGTAQSADKLVYAEPKHPDWSFSAQVTDDGRYLIISVRKADDEHFRIVFLDLMNRDAWPGVLIEHFENQFYFAGSDGPVFYFVTDRGAPRRRLVAINSDQPREQDWKTLIPEGATTLVSVSLVANRFIAQQLKDAASQVSVYSLSGEPQGTLKFPTLGTAVGFHGRRDDQETFYAFSSFTRPATIYRYEVAENRSVPFEQPQLTFDPNDYQVEQFFVRSKDSTKVPMTVCFKKGIKRDKENPTLLYGYGGFGISLPPRFAPSAVAWMQMGGIYAVANLRGGGEYGEAWHQAGTKTNKQNVFDDFAAAAQWLFDQRYTRPAKLAIQGGSNGGLLVAALLTQRPQMFGACLAEVPVTDMLRFHHFTDGRFWVTDYGSPDVEEEFQALRSYSPYHNLEPGRAYPPTLVTTADTDDRVIPFHSYKFVAELQHCQGSAAPVLLRVDTRSGHGAGKPTAQRIDELADLFVFLAKNLQITLPAPAAR